MSSDQSAKPDLLVAKDLRLAVTASDRADWHKVSAALRTILETDFDDWIDEDVMGDFGTYDLLSPDRSIGEVCSIFLAELPEEANGLTVLCTPAVDITDDLGPSMFPQWNEYYDSDGQSVVYLIVREEGPEELTVDAVLARVDHQFSASFYSYYTPGNVAELLAHVL